MDHIRDHLFDAGTKEKVQESSHLDGTVGGETQGLVHTPNVVCHTYSESFTSRVCVHEKRPFRESKYRAIHVVQESQVVIAIHFTRVKPIDQRRTQWNHDFYDVRSYLRSELRVSLSKYDFYGVNNATLPTSQDSCLNGDFNKASLCVSEIL
jgi:hypothetical protein